MPRTVARFGWLAVSLVASLCLPAEGMGAEVQLEFLDAPGTGMYDQTPVGPVGGNPGITLGEQRREAFQRAARIWAIHFESAVPIHIQVEFNPLGGGPTAAPLGFASPSSGHFDFVGAPLPETWYVAAQANALHGADLNGEGTPDITATFNQNVDGDVVLGEKGFYYGLDSNAGDQIDFVGVALHEIAHGLGFIDLLERATGRRLEGMDDPFILNVRNHNFSPPRLAEMSAVQRMQAITDGPFLVWDGPAVVAESWRLGAGTGPDGVVQLHAPSTLSPTASLNHFSEFVDPDELMEPIAGSSHRVLLTLAAFEDMGWPLSNYFCGDANEDGALTTSDALRTLRAAVGLDQCDLLRCDVDLSLHLSSVDSLIVLRSAVGLPMGRQCF